MTYNFLVLGSGLQGSSAASILAGTDLSNKIYLLDIDRRMLEKVSRKIDSEKLIPLHGDITKVDIPKDIDITLNFLPPIYNDIALNLSLKLGSIYVDTASGPDKDLNPIDTNVLKVYKYVDRFRDKGISAIISSGATPGLTNFMARLLYDMMDGVKEIRYYACGYPLDIPIFYEPIAPYMDMLFASWNVETAFLYRATPPVIYRGRYIRREIFGDPKYYDFGEPINKLLTVLVEHEEVVTTPIHLNIDYVEYRNPPDYLAYALIKYGFTDMDRILDIDGVKVNPYKLLKKLLPKPGNKFLDDKYMDNPVEAHIERLVVEAVDGDKILRGSLDLEIPPIEREERKRFYRLYGTTYIYVALPAIASGLYAYEQGLKGVYAPEAFDPQVYIKYLETLGYRPNIKIMEYT